MSNSNVSSKSSLNIRPLDAALGAEVTGLDLSQSQTVDTMQAIHDAWMAHLVLVFPQQAISDEQQIAFARQFGELEVHHQDIIRSQSAPEIFRVSNVTDDGELMDASHASVAQISLAQRWHTDSSFRPIPSMGSILHGLEVTSEGGQTWFTNMYKVYDALSEDLRGQIEGRKACHDFGHLSTLAPIKPLSPSERQAMPPVWQPMVRQHPVTGRKSLFISPIYNNAVEGMDDDAALALIAELTELSENDAFVYRHIWSSDDIVMWDNRCTMHRVTPYDLGLRRVMHRATIVGDGPVFAG